MDRQLNISKIPQTKKLVYRGFRIETVTQTTESMMSKDISFQTMRSTGPGGQNVNKVNSAVRAIHNPTGSSSSCHG